MARKVFEYEPAVESETPEFEVAGEVFHCVATAEMSSLDVMDAVAGLTSGDGSTRISWVMKLFNTFIAADDVERFRKTVQSANIPIPTLNEIASWVLNEYLRFPTPEDRQSSNGSQPAASSNGDVSSPPPDATWGI